MKYVYGIALCVLIAIIAIFFSAYIPIGAVALSIITGIIVGNLLKPGEIFKKGTAFCEKNVLSFAIALTGINLNFMVLKKLGFQTIFLIVIAISVTLTSALLISKLLNFNKKFGLLIGIGNGICGSSAIAATEKIIGVKSEETGIAIAVVNFLGTIGIFLLPFLSRILLHFSDINSGIAIGNTLQAVGQVIAAGFSIDDIAGQTATIVKMARILMLFPVVFILIFAFKKQNSSKDNSIKIPTVPLFIVGFIVFSLIPTFGILPENIIKIIGKIGHYSLIIAMAAIGLKITFRSLLNNGKSALSIGMLIFSVQILFSLSVLYFLFN